MDGIFAIRECNSNVYAKYKEMLDGVISNLKGRRCENLWLVFFNIGKESHVRNRGNCGSIIAIM